MSEFARKHSLYNEYLPITIKLILAHEYSDYTVRWMWNFAAVLNKLNIPAKYKTRADPYGYSPFHGDILQAIAEAGIAVINYCYDPLMQSYCQHKLRLI